MAPNQPPPQRLMPAAELSAKVREYEQFANDVLKVDLQKTAGQRAQHQAEIEELEELRRNIQQLLQQQQQQQQEKAIGGTNKQKKMKSQVELGPGVYCRAVVPDTSHIFISIGLGFHLEVTLEEAGRVIDLKQQALRAQVDRCVDKAARIKANLKFVSEAIRELMDLPASGV